MRPKTKHKRCSDCGMLHTRKRRTVNRAGEVGFSWQSKCAECHAKYMRETRPKYSELTPAQRLKANCRTHTKVLIKRGKLIPQNCEVCGSDEDVQAHHEDYSKPKLVKWLCRSHHIDLHKGTLDYWKALGFNSITEAQNAANQQQNSRA